MLRRMLVLGALVLALAFNLPADVIYLEDFESGSIGPEWSMGPGSNSALNIEYTPVGNRAYLGQFWTDTAILSLSSVPLGEVTLSFDLFLMYSWDGNDAAPWGPDFFGVSVGSSGPILMNTTFATLTGGMQAYPNLFGVGNNPAGTGATETDTLGYFWEDGQPADNVYHLVLKFNNTSGNVTFNFYGVGLQNLTGQGAPDERWGLDNVQVEGTVIPEPGTLLLFGGAGAALLLFRRLRK